MEISIAYPIQTMYGRIGDFHFYHFNGRTYLRRNPKCTKPKSPAQLECMENFKAKYCKKK